MRKWTLAVVLLLALPAVAAAQRIDPLSPAFSPKIDENPSHYPSNIWITGPLEKVRQDSGEPGKVHWAIVYATQNEIQSFQVHVKAPAGGIRKLNVTVSDLVQTAPSHYAISASSTDIVVYREAYMHVYPKVTAVSSTYYGTTGYYPDPLIPAVDPYYHQRTNAFPFDVAGENDQSVWIDVHVPPSAPSGYYLGKVTVSGDDHKLAEMPVVYAIWQWPASAGGRMPSTATLTYITGIGYASLCKQEYGDSSCDGYPNGVGGMEADFGAQALDNRMNSATTNVFPDTGSFSQFKAELGPLFDGKLRGLNVRTILPGARRTAMQLNCAGGCLNPGINTRGIIENWVKNFQAEKWLPTLFYYLWDEPTSDKDWVGVNANAREIRSYSDPKLPMLVEADLATAQKHDALDSIDWLVVLVNNMEPIGGTGQRSSYDNWLSGNCCGGAGPKRRLMSYQSCSSSGTCGNGTVGSGVTYPNYDVDGLPVANRVMEWMTFRNNESGELYYLQDGCFYYPCGTGTTDPWISVYEYGNWGDGDLWYPGTTAHVGVKIPIWIPSIRVKMIRDGMQDYEYLNLMANEGKESLVQREISSWITNGYTFDMNPGGLARARQALGNAMHELNYPANLQGSSNRVGTPE